MLFDDILKELGGFGPFQKRIYFLVSLYSIPWAFHAISSVFLAGQSDHWCYTPAPQTLAPNATFSYFNCSSNALEREKTQRCEEAWKNLTIPSEVVNEETVYDQCQKFDPAIVGTFSYDESEVNTTKWNGSQILTTTSVNITTESCGASGWVYDRSQYTSTIRQDFNLVCDNKNLPSYADSAYFAGFLLGGLLFGNLADWIGRYLSFFIAIGGMSVSGIIAAFSPNFVTFAVMRFFIGLSNMAGFVGFIMCSEIVSPDYRGMAGNVIWLFFSTGYMILAVLAYFIRDWRYLQLAISVPALAFFLLIPILYESPRWLISRGKYDKAEKVIRKAASVNKIKLPEVLFEEQDKLQQQEKGGTTLGTPLDLFRTPNLRAKTLILFYNWFVNNMVYYGLSLGTSSLGVNDYLAAFVSGAVEFPAYLSCWFVVDRFGRRLPMCIYMVGGGVACILSALTPPGVTRTIIAMIGKFGITASFSLAFIMAGEIFPTPVRSIGMGMSSMSARLSGILAPFILLLGNYWEPLPVIFFGVNSIIAGLLALLLPETLGTSLPQTLEEGEAFGKDEWPCLSFCKGGNKSAEYKPAPRQEADGGAKDTPVAV